MSKEYKVDWSKLDIAEIFEVQLAIKQGIDPRWLLEIRNLSSFHYLGVMQLNAKQMAKVRNNFNRLNLNDLDFESFDKNQRFFIISGCLESLNIKRYAKPHYSYIKMIIFFNILNKAIPEQIQYLNRIDNEIQYSDNHLECIFQLISVGIDPKPICTLDYDGHQIYSLMIVLLRNLDIPFIFDKTINSIDMNAIIDLTDLGVHLSSYNEYKENINVFEIILNDFKFISQDTIRQYASLYPDIKNFWFTRELLTGYKPIIRENEEE